MSKGNIRKKRNAKVEERLDKLTLEEGIYAIMRTCEVLVDDELWKAGDEKIKQELEKLRENLEDIKQRLGANEGDISKEIEALKAQIEEIKSRKPLDLIVQVNDAEKVDVGLQHNQFPTLLKILASKLNVYLVGPSGSGKTHAAAQCAKALGVPFHFTGAVASEFKLTGFIDAQGKIVSTEFRKAYEKGGVFLFDELDASYPQAVLAFNAALANDFMDFPDKRVERHKDFYCIAAANTYGQGADRQYIGRNQLDAASLDRFAFVNWDYDEKLERALAKNDKWVDQVQLIRDIARKLKVRHVISPRASIFGAQLLSNGLDQETVEKVVIWKGTDNATREKVMKWMFPVDINSPREGTFYCEIEKGDLVKESQQLGRVELDYYSKSTINSSVNGVVKKVTKKENVAEGDFLIQIMPKLDE